MVGKREVCYKSVWESSSQIAFPREDGYIETSLIVRIIETSLIVRKV